MRPSLRQVATAALLAIVLAPACKRSKPAPPPPPALGEVTVRDLAPAREPGARLDVPALREALRARLLASGLFAGVAGADGGAPTGAVVRARCEVGGEAVEVGAKGVARAA